MANRKRAANKPTPTPQPVENNDTDQDEKTAEIKAVNAVKIPASLVPGSTFAARKAARMGTRS